MSLQVEQACWGTFQPFLGEDALEIYFAIVWSYKGSRQGFPARVHILSMALKLFKKIHDGGRLRDRPAWRTTDCDAFLSGSWEDSREVLWPWIRLLRFEGWVSTHAQVLIWKLSGSTLANAWLKTYVCSHIRYAETLILEVIRVTPPTTKSIELVFREARHYFECWVIKSIHLDQ